MAEVLKNKNLFYLSIWVSIHDSKTVYFCQQCRMKDCCSVFMPYFSIIPSLLISVLCNRHCTEGPQLFTKKPKHLKAVSVWPLGRACPFGHTTFSNVGVLLSNWVSVHILLWCSILQLMQVNIYSSVLKLQVMNMPLHPSLTIFQKDCCMFIVWYTLSFNPM